MAVVSQIKLSMRRIMMEKCQGLDAAKKFLDSVVYRVFLAKFVFQLRCTGTKKS